MKQDATQESPSPTSPSTDPLLYFAARKTLMTMSGRSTWRKPEPSVGITQAERIVSVNTAQRDMLKTKNRGTFDNVPEAGMPTVTTRALEPVPSA